MNRFNTFTFQDWQQDFKKYVQAFFLQSNIIKCLKKDVALCADANTGPGQGCLILSGYSVVGRPPFIPMKVACWYMKPKMIDFLGLKISIPICSGIIWPIEHT